MKIISTSLIGIVFVALSMFGLPAIANTSDGQTPAQETVCDIGVLEENMFGICNAYCEAMDCDNPDHKASDKACQKKLQQWSDIAGENPLPCNEAASISLAKTVNSEYNTDTDQFEIPVDDPVIYTFGIVNNGNVPIANIQLSDPTIVAALDGCAAALAWKTLEINEEITCESDVDEVIALEGMVNNTAFVTGASIYYGTTVSDTSDATYTGVDLPTTPYEIGGEGPGGGIVFYLDDVGGGLEAAREDQTSTTATWGCYTLDIGGIANTTTFPPQPDTATGASKTMAIISECSERPIAASIASSYMWPNGQTDGYLPDHEELNLLYLQRLVVGDIAQAAYWSSSENICGGQICALSLYMHPFFGGNPFQDDKRSDHLVRAVRAF